MLSRNIMSCYAVARGRNPGIYYTWDECKAQVDGYSNAKFKKFKNNTDANQYMQDYGDIDNITTDISSINIDDNSVSNINNNIPGRSQVFMPQSKLFFVRNKEPKMNDPYIQSRILGRHLLTYQDHRLVVWTDGGCRNNGTNKELGGVGVYFADYSKYNISHKMIGTTNSPVTNNRAEMLAVIMALQKIKDNMPDTKRIEIRTDSQYIVNVMTIYMQNWINKNNTSYKNKDLWDRLMILSQDFDIKWTHVRGHAGVYGNEQADMLVNQAIDS